MTLVRSLSPIVVSIAVTLMWIAVAHAQTPEQINACAANKTEASGEYMDAVIDCHTRVARDGAGGEARCVMQAAQTLTRAFAAIERAGGCATINDAPMVIARINSSVTDRVAMLDASNSALCLKHQLKAMGTAAEHQARCVADAVSKGAGYSADPECQSSVSDRFFAEFERANVHGCTVTGDVAAIDAAIRAAAASARNAIKWPLSTCAPIEVTALHGGNLTGNTRLAKIENGKVACMHVDDATIASCAFSTVPGRQTGEWLESPDGNFALAGQALRLDGTPGGEYIVVAAVRTAAPASCVEPTSMDTAGRIAEGIELNNECVVEDLNTDYNATAASQGFFPLVNYADREVCTANRPGTHPDFANLTRSYSSSGSGPDDTFCYQGPGAALNDINGTERDSGGVYFPGKEFCHFIQISGYEAPAAKRPATFSYPAPGGINTRSSIAWRPVSPHFVVANGNATSTVQQFTSKPGFLNGAGANAASGPLPDLGDVGTSVTIGTITFSLALSGNTLFVGATGTGAEPDWYPDLPGNDIAMGFESLQLQFATPVYGLGFDFVEPNVTMPASGGTPEDSTFDIALYRGAVEVGRASFNAEDDLVGFIGVWSSVAFDRATIIDRTGNHDNEFFGQFYVTTVPKP